MKTAQVEECVDCGVAIEDGLRVLCPPCHVWAAHGSTQKDIELMERFRKANPERREP